MNEQKAIAATKTLVGPAWYHRPGVQPRPEGSCGHLRWSHRRALTYPRRTGYKGTGAKGQVDPGSLTRACYYGSLCLPDE